MFGLAIFFMAFALIFRLFLAWLNTPERKGKEGENLVARRLRAGLTDEYEIINDVYLPLPDGTTTQIDHVIVSPYGIFVVETKHYSGWIFGDEKSAQWTQSIYGKKSRFQNPLRQNYRHICALSENLGMDMSFFFSVVAFTGELTFKTEMPPNVVYSRFAADYIKSIRTPLIQAEQVDVIVSRIEILRKSVSAEQKARHVENLKKRHASPPPLPSPELPPPPLPLPPSVASR